MSNDIRTQLDRISSELDELTVARLRAARKRAVAATRVRPAFLAWLPISATAAAAVAALAVVLWWHAPEPSVLATDDFEWSATRDDPDLFTDLDFYDWIRQEQDAG